MHSAALPDAAVPAAATLPQAPVAPLTARRTRSKKPSCGQCYFGANGLCALGLDGPCPTFRQNHPQGLMPPQQPELLPLAV